MSTVAEIEAAIKALPPAERERLAEDLPSILPELHGDLVGDASLRTRVLVRTLFIGRSNRGPIGRAQLRH